LFDDPDGRVRHLALVTLADADSRFALDRIDRIEGVADPETSAAVGYCLLKLGDKRQRDAGLARLDALRSGQPADRLALAWTLARSSDRLPLDWLYELMRDTDCSVRSAAAKAAGRHRDLDFVEPLCELLYSDRTAPAAEAALVALGDGAIPRLLANYRQTDQGWLRLRTIAVLRSIGSAAAAEALLDCLDVDEAWIGAELLQALIDLQRAGRLPEPDRQRLDAYLEREEWSLGFYMARLEALVTAKGADGDYARTLQQKVRERAAAALEHCCQILELLFPAREILAAYRQYRDGDPVARANAVVFLDSVLPRGHRRNVIEYMEELPLRQRLQRANIKVPQTVVVALRSLAARNDDLMRALVLVAAVDYDVVDRLGQVAGAAPGAHPVLREVVTRFGYQQERRSA
jgi:HEAT repeat protein